MTIAVGSVPSPCIGICRIQPASGLCEGCLRTLDEIARWSSLGDDEKRIIWASLPPRRAARVQVSGHRGDGETA